MAKKILLRAATTPGTMTVTVTDVGDDGSVISGAVVSLYRAPAGTTDDRFDAGTWSVTSQLASDRPRPNAKGRSPSPDSSRGSTS